LRIGGNGRFRHSDKPIARSQPAAAHSARYDPHATAIAALVLE